MPPVRFWRWALRSCGLIGLFSVGIISPSIVFFSVPEFIQQPGVILVFSALLAVAITGGMFVVPLYAFLTTTVEKDHTARTVAANNIMTSGAMVLGGFFAALASNSGFSTSQILYSVAGMCCVAAWLSWRLHCSCD